MDPAPNAPVPAPSNPPPTIMLMRQPEVVEPGVDLAAVVRFFYEYRLTILGWVFGFGLGAVALVFTLVPRTYEASAVIAVVAPKIESSMAPAAMSVQAYQRILESDAIQAEVRRTLIQEGVLGLQDRPKFTTAIFVAKRSEEVSLAPFIQVSVVDLQAERAAKIVNRWAEIFMERVKALHGGATGPLVNVVDAQFAKAREDLSSTELARNQAADEEGVRHAALVTTWDAKVSELQVSQTRARAEYDDATKRQLEAFQADQQLDTQRIVLEAIRKSLEAVRGDYEAVTLRASQIDDEVQAAGAVLARTPTALIMRKAISDDGAWQATADSQQALLAKGMFTEQANPVHTDLKTRLSNLEVERGALSTRRQAMMSEMVAKREVLKTLETTYRTALSDLDQLTRARLTGQQALIEEQGLAMGLLKRNRELILVASQQTQQARLAALDRTVAQVKGLYEQMAKYQLQGQLSRVQEQQAEFQLVSPAVAPDRPEASRRLLMVIAALFLGGLLGLGHAVVRRLLPRAI